MQFPNPIVTEITAPNNVPFLPGNTITGFGSQIPPELMALGFNNAIVFYDVDWNPAATTPSVKFRFIASGFGVIQVGFGYCANPSVSQTATVVTTETIGGVVSGANIGSTVTIRNHLQQTTFHFGQYYTTGDPVFEMFDQTAVARMLLQHIASTGIASLGFANWQLAVADGSSFASVNHHILGDSTWQAFTLFNGWTGAGSPNAPLYRRMCDGTVQMTGIVTKATPPVNGERWGSVGASYLPKGAMNAWAPSSLAAAASQKITVETNGDCLVFDSPAGNGSCFLNLMRYPLADLP